MLHLGLLEGVIRHLGKRETTVNGSEHYFAWAPAPPPDFRLPSHGQLLIEVSPAISRIWQLVIGSSDTQLAHMLDKGSREGLRHPAFGDLKVRALPCLALLCLTLVTMEDMASSALHTHSSMPGWHDHESSERQHLALYACLLLAWPCHCIAQWQSNVEQSIMNV